MVKNINHIPLDIDVTKTTVAEVDGTMVLLGGIGEVTFEYSSDAEIFLQGLDYALSRLDEAYVVSKPAFRNFSTFCGEWVVRIGIGDQDDNDNNGLPVWVEDE